MKKRIGLYWKEEIIKEIKEKVKDAEACFFINFKKISASAFNTLRNRLNLSGAKVFVSKNTLLKKVFEELGIENLNGFLGEGTGLVLVYDKDIVKACKVLFDFNKENENLKLKGGFLGNKKISLEEFNALSKLPSKEVLLNTLMGTIISPLTGLLYLFNSTLYQFNLILEDIEKRKS